MQVPMLFGPANKPFRLFRSVDHEQELAQENQILTSKCSILVESCKADDLNQLKSCLNEENCNIDIDDYYWLDVDPMLNRGIKHFLRTPLMIAATFGSISVLQHIIDSNKADISKFASYDKNRRPQTALLCAREAIPPRHDVIERLINAARPNNSWDKKLKEVSRSHYNEEGYAKYDTRFLEDKLEKFPTLATAKTIRPSRSWMRRNPGRNLYEPEGSKESEKEYLDKKKQQELFIATLRSWPKKLVESQYQCYQAPGTASEISSSANNQPEPELAWIRQLVDEFYNDEGTWKTNMLHIE